MENTLKLQVSKLPDIAGLPAERFTWPYRQQSLRLHMLREENLDNFLKWSTVSEAFFTGTTGYVKDIYDELPERYKSVISDSGIGNPEIYRGTSGTYILQAYYIWRWEQATKKDIAEQAHIVEFGGGYGVMALLSHRLGFRGTYIIIDLPEAHLLQMYYLKAHGLNTIFYLDKYIGTTDLLVACCSLSEVEPKISGKFLGQLYYRHNLIVYQNSWMFPTIGGYFSKSTQFPNPHYMNHWMAIR